MTNGLGEFANSIVADVEVSKTFAFHETVWKGGEKVVGEGKPGVCQ